MFTTRFSLSGTAAMCGLCLLAGCANHMSQRSEQEARTERKPVEHHLSLEVGDPLMEQPQRRVRVTEQSTFEVTDFEVTRRYDRYTPYQPWREFYEVPLGAVAVVAGVAANALNVVLLGRLPENVTHGWINYGFAGVNPFMNTQSNGRAEQNLAGIEEVQRDKRQEVLAEPWVEKPVEVTAGSEVYALNTDSKGYLRLNLLDAPFADQDLRRVNRLVLMAKDDDGTSRADATLQLAATLRTRVAEARGLIYDDLEDDEVSQWVYRVKRLSQLGFEDEANGLQQSLLELTRNDPELHQDFIKALARDAGRVVDQ
ncbi:MULTISPECIES: hypothetical protein [Pseudomonas]|uniref:Lipoprotein n=1 Tax=Pseudomonas quercus TaxID=2722792 RepID=A0ABX0YDQ2_9PSED|nr:MULTISPECIES: hypothetical protein [Pseudomonas]MBF7141659.1 hypothetical protein [Pseudomonas sp. LY10J]NJP00198.1 hypothetical protein [Pseudomonas quercus]